MILVKPDFSKIFAQNGAVTALNDNQFLQGFEYLGDNPPTKEEFNWLFQQFCLKMQYLNSQGDSIFRQNSTDYVVGDVKHSLTLPSWAYLECTVAGTTAAIEPIWPSAGQTVVDGTVTWAVRDMRVADTQFDKSTKLATTAFVKAAGIQYSKITIKAVSTVLTAVDAGSFVIAYGNTGPIMFTLPLSSTMVTSATLCFLNASAYPVTITRQGTDQINPATTTVTSIVLQPGDTFNVSLFVNIWECFGGSGALAACSAFGSSLFSSGYQKLPSGFIIQWGHMNYSSSDLVTTLPIAFPTAFLQVVVCSGYTAGSGAIGYVAASPTTLSTFTSRASNGSLGANFIAIGK